MLSSIESSIIIPVYNQWTFTQACLVALKDTLPKNKCEVIVVDNASTDETKEECLRLGKELFGELFQYERFNQNCNFGPACNHGAKCAHGEFLVFLNNDTLPLLGWYKPLLDDFVKFPDIAATGPLLLYPESDPFGFTVQHLGVFVSPTLQVGHLYEGIPADSVLAKKRRFFQIITAACMVMRRSVFFDIGMFDEGFINGFEDVDLCLRLWESGFRMTVNPEARVVHYTSQTPGRHTHERKNSEHLRQRNLQRIVPDLHIHVKNDGYELHLSQWQTLQISLPKKQNDSLHSIATRGSLGEIKNTLLRFPLWKEGYSALLAHMETEGINRDALFLSYCKIWPSPLALMDLYCSSCQQKNNQIADFALQSLLNICKSYESYILTAQAMYAWVQDIQLTDLANDYNCWWEKQEEFRHELYLPFLQKLWTLAQHFPLSPDEAWAYTLWRELANANPTLPATDTSAVKFSILMPVYNPDPEHLTVAIQSVLQQSHPFWELCIVDDASSNTETKVLLEELGCQDKRIHITYRPQNGYIAAATNTALAMANCEYVVLMDQDDLLTPNALQEMASAIVANPAGLLFYSDEDKIADDGDMFAPHFKNNKWDWEMLAGQNFVNHLGVYRADKLRAIGGFRDGFPGAQDFDMLLRYTQGVADSLLIHVPHVLYHWRAHAGSTAANVGVKSDALESTRKALQEHLDTVCPGAKALFIPNVQPLRVQYPLPQKKPLVTIAIDVEEGIALAQAQVESLGSKTAYAKYEVILLYNQNADQHSINKTQRWVKQQSNVRLFSYDASDSLADRQNIILDAARGAIIGFLAKGAVALTDNWLEEIISRLSQDRVGVIGGKLLTADGALLHGGYITDATGGVALTMHGNAHNEPGYFSWAKIARTVDALDSLCFFTHTHLLRTLGSFDETLPLTAIQDYCLRLAKEGYRSVWTPFAEFILLSIPDLLWIKNGYVTEKEFNKRWDGIVTAWTPYLVAAHKGWVFNKKNFNKEILPAYTSSPQLQKQLRSSLKKPAPFTSIAASVHDLVDEEFYYNSNPDVRDAGISAYIHYITNGYAEGRSPNADFDTSFYMQQYPELYATEQNPLEHYICIGKDRGAIYKKPPVLLRGYNGTYQELREAALPDNSCRVIAWYLPQFHPIGENDIAWGKGFTEWTNVAAAKPRFKGHYQPRLPGALGFYDLRRKEALEEQILLAKHAGIYGFCLHHYWFEGHATLRTPLEHLKNTPSLDFPFCLHWANEGWTRRWDGGSQGIIIPQGHSSEDDLNFIKDIAWALKDKRYIRFQGKPVLGVYRPDLFPEISATLDRWRVYCKQEGIGDIFLFSSRSFNNTPELIVEYGFDGVVEYPPHGSPTPQRNAQYADKGLQYSGALRSYTEFRDTFLKYTAHAYEAPRFRGVMPSWDNSARSNTGSIFDGATYQEYQSWLKTSIARAKQDKYEGEKYLFVNAWNEWAEAAYLEPDEECGYALLNATAEAVSTKIDLPYVLFVCDLDDSQQEQWLEALLLQNKSSPLYKPVVFVPKPFHSIGTFKGLAPLLCSFTRSDATSLKRLFAKSGYFSFAFCILAQPLSKEQMCGIVDMSSAIIHCPEYTVSTTPVTYHHPEKDIWIADNVTVEITQWNLQHSSTHKQTSVVLLLRKLAVQNKDKVEITAIVLPPEDNDISLEALRQAQITCHYTMEVVVPQALEAPCTGSFTLLRGVSAHDKNEFILFALQQAKGDFIWIITPENKVFPDLPNMLRIPFVDNNVACVRTYFPKEFENIPHLFGKDTVMFSGGEFVAPESMVDISHQINMMMFRKKDLMACLQAAHSGADVLHTIVSAGYKECCMAIVPKQFES